MAMPDTRGIAAGYPLSRNELRKVAGLGRGPLRDFMEFYASRDNSVFFDDFLGDTINLDMYAVANGGGASVASFATNVQRGGVIRATTGTANDDTASASLIMPLNWYGDNNCGMEARWKLETSVAAYKVEIGFIDAVPASNAGGVTDEDTPTAAFADGAMMSVDTSETFTTPGFYTKGSTASQNIARTSMAGIPGLTNGVTPLISTYVTTRVQIQGNNAFCWMNGRLVASHNTQAAGHVEGGVALAPWVYVSAKSATSKSLDLDYLLVWQDRT
jgi:hypothetical protein